MVRLRYLSLGAGVQSSALMVMSALGLRGCPKADVAIFADTQDEPAWVYAQLELLKIWGEQHGLPVKVVSAGQLSSDLIKGAVEDGQRFATIPAFTMGEDREAILRRQCTKEYKILPIMRCARRLLGAEPHQRIPPGTAEALIGISVDEAARMKPAHWKWITNRYPLIEAAMTRSACLALLQEHGLPEPKKSSCIFCPYHSDAYWLMLKSEHPDEWAKAIAFDEHIRHQTKSGLVRPVFLHRTCIPLRDITFDTRQSRFNFEGFGNECEGHCGV